MTLQVFSSDLLYVSLMDVIGNHLPLILNVLVDHTSNAHRYNGIVPRGDEHKR